MDKDTALRLALEALEDLGNHDRICPQWPTYAEPENYPKCNCGYDQAITAIKAALEAKDEPVKAWCETCEGGGKVYQEHQAGCWVGGEHACPDCDGNGYYTHPPQRTWVGLTDEEIGDFASGYRSGRIGSFVELTESIEAKLKEKNT